jgi:uncharacterized membrane protein YwaF
MGNFGSKHLFGLLWLFSVITIVLIILLIIRKKFHYGNRYDRRVILGASIFVWIWEIIKSIYMIKSESFGGVGNYPSFMLPFHICSMALYAFPIIARKEGKLADFVKPFAFAVMLLMTSIILTIPDSSGIMGNLPHWGFTYENVLPYQSFLYHGTLVFVPLYMVLSGFYRPHISDIGKSMAVLLIVATFAFTINKILGTTDFMTLEYGNGNPFQSLITKNYPLYIVLLFSVSAGGTGLVLGVSDLLVSLREKRITNAYEASYRARNECAKGFSVHHQK